jgi:hypothetical protein
VTEPDQCTARCPGKSPPGCRADRRRYLGAGQCPLVRPREMHLACWPPGGFQPWDR